MSKTDNKKDSLALLDQKNEKKFWRDQRAMNIFNMFIQGKDIGDIAETLNMKPLTVESLITNKYFIRKLETHMRGVLFTNQVARVIAASEIFSKLWERVSDNIEEIPPEICLKELTKMFPRKKEGVLINPKNMNVFMQVMKGERSPEDLGSKLAELDDGESGVINDDDFGFEGLEDDDSEYPELENEEDANSEQQRDPGMDQEEPGQDK